MTDRKIQLGVGLDATGAKTGADQVAATIQEMAAKILAASKNAGKGIDGLGLSTDESAKKAKRSAESFEASMQRITAATLAGGKETANYQRIIAAQKGIAPEISEPLIKSYADAIIATKAAAAATGVFNTSLGATGMTAKATNAALRQVPQQLTDIVVSLQGGQAPLTVLLQQGGQLKDIFGGIGAAARAMGGYLLSLVNPYSVTAAAIAAIAVAYGLGAKESDAFNKALVLTGNTTGTTVDHLNDLSVAISKSTGVTRGAAAAALTEFAASGGVAADQLQRVTEAAVNLERYAGVAVSKTVEQFAAIGKAPLSASVKLNESTHFLTVAVYEQIRALEQQGRSYEAVQVAQNAFANATDVMAEKMKLQLGTIERGWLAIKDVVKGIGSDILSIGRPTSTAEKIADMETRIKNRKNFVLSDSDVESMRQQIVYLKRVQDAIDAVAKAEGERTRVVENRIKWDEKGLEFLTKEEKKDKEVAAARNLGVAAGMTPKQIDTRVAQIRRDIPAEKANDKAYADYKVALVQKELESELNLYVNYNKELDALHTAGIVSDADYYAAKQAAVTISTKLAVDAIKAEIAAESSRKITGDSEIERDTIRIETKTKILGMQSKLNNAIQDGAAKSKVLTEQETAAVSALARALDQAKQSAVEATAATARAYNRERQGFSRGDLARSTISEQGAIEERAATERKAIEDRRALDKRVINDPEIAKQYDALLAVVQSKADAEKAIWNAQYAWRRNAESESMSGAKRALENYANNSANAAANMENAVTSSLKTMEDEILNLTETGSLNFSKMADSIIMNMLRVQTQQMITGPIAGWLNGMMGGGNSVAGLDNAGAAFNAHGNVFSADTGLASYRNTVVTTPTVFPFAKGIGLMGEKSGSPGEAIMPLSRMSGGDLGVKVEGSGTTITYAPVVNIDSRTDRMEVAVIVDRAIRNGNAELVDRLMRERRIS